MELPRRAWVLFCVFAAGLWSVAVAFIAIPFFLLAPTIGFRIQRLWGSGWCWLLRIHVNFRDLHHLQLPSGGAILAPNHESMFDPVILAMLPVNLSWISKKQVGNIPVIGWAMRAMGCYFVSRDRSGADVNVMRQVEGGLRAGKWVTIFPEGTRTRTGMLLPFKRGAFRTAQNTGVPLIPVGISGTWSIAPPGRIPRHRGHRVVITIGEPFPVPSGMPMEPIMASFRSVLVGLIEESRYLVNNT